MTIPAKNQHPDTALRETANAKTQLGTYLAPDAPPTALFVSRGTGALGANQAAVSVAPGAGIVDGTEHTIPSEKPVDISGGDGQPRRDVVYLDDSGSIAVKEGTPAPFAWDETLEQSERAPTNAYRPPAPDLAGTKGLALATVTIGANSGTLSTGAIDPIRPLAPSSVQTTPEVIDTYGGKINGVWVLDPAASDFGAAINAVDAQMTAGDHLYIPPASYDCATTGVLSTANIVVYGDATGSAYNDAALPKIHQTSDVPSLQMDNTNQTVRGVTFASEITGSTDGLQSFGARNTIRDCSVRAFGKNGIHIRQEDGRSVNNSVVENCSVLFCKGDGVRVSRASGSAANANALSIQLRNSTDNHGWGINVPDWTMGNEYKILNFTGNDPNQPASDGGIRHVGIDSYARLVYWEGRQNTETGIKFEQAGNVGEIHHTQNDYPFDRFYTDNAPGNNFKWQYAHPDRPIFVGDLFSVGSELSATELSAKNAVSRMHQTAPQTIQKRTFTQVDFGAVDADELGGMDTANDQFTATEGGAFHVTGSVFCTTGPGARIIVQLSVNGSKRVWDEGYVSDGPHMGQSASDTLRLSAGDVITLEVYQGSNGPQDTRANSAETFLTVTKVG